MRKNGDHVRLGVLRGDRKVPGVDVKPGLTGIADLADPDKGLVP